MDNPASDPATMARLQFAVTVLFHILWPVLTIGLSCFILAAEILWFKNGWRNLCHAR